MGKAGANLWFDRSLFQRFLFGTIFALLALSILAGCKTKEIAVEEEKFIDIPIRDITETVTFFSEIINDIEMEVMAVLTKDGSILTAFNRCERCHKTGKGFLQEGKEVICRQCNMRFGIDKIGLEQNRCSPVIITDEEKIITEELIQISHKVLSKYTYLFIAWEPEPAEKAE